MEMFAFKLNLKISPNEKITLYIYIYDIVSPFHLFKIIFISAQLKFSNEIFNNQMTQSPIVGFYVVYLPYSLKNVVDYLIKLIMGVMCLRF
jgi:hypothetical protein